MAIKKLYKHIRFGIRDSGVKYYIESIKYGYKFVWKVIVKDLESGESKEIKCIKSREEAIHCINKDIVAQLEQCSY